MPLFRVASVSAGFLWKFGGELVRRASIWCASIGVKAQKIGEKSRRGLFCGRKATARRCGSRGGDRAVRDARRARGGSPAHKSIMRPNAARPPPQGGSGRHDARALVGCPAQAPNRRLSALANAGVGRAGRKPVPHCVPHRGRAATSSAGWQGSGQSVVAACLAIAEEAEQAEAERHHRPSRRLRHSSRDRGEVKSD